MRCRYVTWALWIDVDKEVGVFLDVIVACRWQPLRDAVRTAGKQRGVDFAQWRVNKRDLVTYLEENTKRAFEDLPEFQWPERPTAPPTRATPEDVMLPS